MKLPCKKKREGKEKKELILAFEEFNKGLLHGGWILGSGRICHEIKYKITKQCAKASDI